MKRSYALVCGIILVIILVATIIAIGLFRVLMTNKSNVNIFWIEQKLDHFNVNDTRTWQMRYKMGKTYYKIGGPIFIYVGGEWPMTDYPFENKFIQDLIKEHHGCLYYTEHRFYGESQPLRNLSTENLQYLNSKQALSDLAHFIRILKTNNTDMAQSKVILLGCSYPGALVVWFKNLYPDLVTAVWASSAPLLNTMNYIDYNVLAGQSIRVLGGSACYERIQNGIAQLEEFIRINRSDLIKIALNLCDNLEPYNEDDIAFIFDQITNTFANLVQYELGGKMIRQVCDEILSKTTDLIGLRNYVLKDWYENEDTRVYLGYNCNNFTYKNHLAFMKNITNLKDYERQWDYQNCNEFGSFMTTDSKQQPFGTKYPLSQEIKRCADIFGAKFTYDYIESRVNETNAYFGGLNLNLDNVLLTQGQLDPWRALGIQDERALMIPDYGHCMDMYSSENTDTNEMRVVKEYITQQLRKWLNG